MIIACLILGLAPFNPPHIWEKLQLLIKGRLFAVNQAGPPDLPWRLSRKF